MNEEKIKLILADPTTPYWIRDLILQSMESLGRGCVSGLFADLRCPKCDTEFEIKIERFEKEKEKVGS